MTESYTSSDVNYRYQLFILREGVRSKKMLGRFVGLTLAIVIAVFLCINSLAFGAFAIAHRIGIFRLFQVVFGDGFTLERAIAKFKAQWCAFAYLLFADVTGCKMIRWEIGW